MKHLLTLLLAFVIFAAPVHAGFFSANNYGTGFIGSGEAVALVSIDPAIDGNMAPKLQLAFGFDKLLEEYKGNTVLLERTSDNSQQAFGFDSTGRFDLGAVNTWRGSSAVELVHFIDQNGTGEVHSFPVQPELVSAAGGVTRFGTNWSETDGQLSRASQGAIGVVYDGSTIYGETTTSGITTSSGMEVHLLISPNNRKTYSSAPDPAELNANSDEEVVWAYSTSGDNYIYERLSAGTALEFGYFSGAGDGGGLIATTNNTSNGAVGTIETVAKRYSTYISSLNMTNSVIERHRLGAKTMSHDVTGANVTAVNNMTNGTFRTGRNTGIGPANYSDFLFGGVIVTDSLTDFERFKIQNRYMALAHQHLLQTVPAMVAQYQEWVDFRDIENDSVTGKNGLLTLNYNTTGTPTWDYNYTTPMGIPGVRSPSGSNTDNSFAAADNYFHDAREASVLVFGHSEINNIFDWFTMNPTVDGDGFGSGTIGFSIGNDHTVPRIITGVDSTLDTNDYTNPPGNFNDQSGGVLSQSMLKYLHKLTLGDWNVTETTSADNTLSPIFGSRFIPSGTVLNQTNILEWVNVYPPTPEGRQDWDLPFRLSGDGLPSLLVATMKPNPSYDYNGTQAAREPFLKKATNKLYGATGVASMPGHYDSGIAIAPGSGNHMHMTTSYKITSGDYQGFTTQGTQLIWAFARNALSKVQVDKTAINLYKVYTQEYSPLEIPNVWGMWLFDEDDVTLTGSLIDQVNDRSGNQRHLTATGSDRPTWQAEDADYNDQPTALGDGATRLTVTGIDDLTGDIIISLVADAESGFSNQQLASFENIGGTVNSGLHLLLASGNLYARAKDGASSYPGPIVSAALPLTKAVWSLVYDNTNGEVSLWKNGTEQGTRATGVGDFHETLGQFTLMGGGNTNYRQKGTMCGAVVLESNSMADRAVAERYLNNRCDVISGHTLTIEGDSNVAEPGPDGQDTIDDALRTMLPGTVTFNNHATSGDEIDPEIDGDKAAVNALATPLGDSNVIIVHAGTNDTQSGEAPATTKANLDALLDSYKGAGYQVILFTQQQVTGTTYDANRKTLNDLIRNDATPSYDALCDIAANDLYSDEIDSASSNGTNYDVGGIHLSSKGYADAAGCAASQWQTLTGVSVTGVTAPSNDTAPIVTGTLEVGETLSFTNGGWSNGVTGYTCTVTNVTDSTPRQSTCDDYTVALSDVEDDIRFSVTAANIAGSNTASTTVTIASLAAPPSASIELLAEGTKSVSQDVATSWNNDGSVGFSYSNTGTDSPGLGATLNGYASIDFDGSNDYLASDDNALRDLFNGAPGATMVAVLKVRNNSSRTIIGFEDRFQIGFAYGGGEADLQVFSQRLDDDTRVGSLFESTDFTDGANVVVAVTLDPNTNEIKAYNGTTQIGSTITNGFASTGNFEATNSSFNWIGRDVLAGGSFYDGEIWEIRVWPSVLSTSDLEDAINFISNKYNLGSMLDNNLIDLENFRRHKKLNRMPEVA